ncbi:DUF934 domain-containing protein [Antarcticimicrobium luteum]|uniref:DUF934 domain-containing protein n=1 Tax=Antarcticimicrobium luteum TaxID=2547397 RepID=A0A4R5VGN6_9RHOB|nr:DUF934 domain-containing protein [Antarcticimicrobium luteum]TDK52156.1 DUF934 domain-containing protein [Antarcticimicrobium luteum]
MTDTALEIAPGTLPETVLVTDAGFSRDDWSGPETRTATLAPDDRAGELSDRLCGLELIRVRFPAFADGRGFTLARDLRRMGYRGRLRAVGHVLADQYAMARRAGFDEVEIDADLAARQPENQWRARANWQAHDYQARLRGRSSGAPA